MTARILIVELREASSADPFVSLQKLCEEAASEIERLMAENAWLAKRIAGAVESNETDCLFKTN